MPISSVRSHGDWAAMRHARIGHDLRGPLQSLVAATALLRRTPLDAQQTGHVDSLEAATGQLIRLIDELIADADAPRTRPEPFAPRKLVQDLVDAVAPRARAAGLDIVGVVDPGVPTVVVADRPRLERILSNLLHNAVKYTPQGSIRLHLAHVGGDRCRFDVEDTGLGIPPERLGAIFDPFVQLDPDNAAGGLGLGLAICQELVERLDGTLSVRSTVGKGSVFSVELTLEAATDPEPRRDSRAFDVGRLAFLFVGLEDTTATGLKGLLAPWRPTIRERADVGAADVAGCDIVVVDCEQAPPDLDLTAAAARIILCGPGRPPPPEHPGTAVVVKPVHAADLHRALVRVLRHQQRASTSSTATAIPDLAGLQLLVADDDPVNADYLRLCLEAAGATVTTTTSPRLIVGLAQERDWSAILVDLEMPGAHGVDVITRLREIEERERRTPIIVVSGYDGEPIDRAYRAGASAHLTKPVTPRELVAVVATFARRADVAPVAVVDPAVAARLKEAQMALLRRDFATLRLVVQGLPPSSSTAALQAAVAARDAVTVQQLLNALGLGQQQLPAGPEPVSSGHGEELITTGLRAVFSAEARVAFEAAVVVAGLRDGSERQQLRGIAHRVAGSAGLFGYHELAEYARFLDVMLRRDDHGDIGASVTAFLAALERVAAPAGG